MMLLVTPDFIRAVINRDLTLLGLLQLPVV